MSKKKKIAHPRVLVTIAVILFWTLVLVATHFTIKIKGIRDGIEAKNNVISVTGSEIEPKMPPSKIDEYRIVSDLILERVNAYIRDTSSNPPEYEHNYRKEAADYVMHYYNLEDNFYWNPAYNRVIAEYLGLLSKNSRRLTLSDIEDIYSEDFSNLRLINTEARYRYIAGKIRDITGMCDLEVFCDVYILDEDYHVCVLVEDFCLTIRAHGVDPDCYVLNYKNGIKSKEYKDFVAQVLEMYPEVRGYRYE